MRGLFSLTAVLRLGVPMPPLWKCDRVAKREKQDARLHVSCVSLPKLPTACCPAKAACSGAQHSFGFCEQSSVPLSTMSSDAMV